MDQDIKLEASNAENRKFYVRHMDEGISELMFCCQSFDVKIGEAKCEMNSCDVELVHIWISDKFRNLGAGIFFMNEIIKNLDPNLPIRLLVSFNIPNAIHIYKKYSSYRGIFPCFIRFSE